MKISEFAQITGIKRVNLIFYDKIGLLSPEYRSENNYRYYSQHQLGLAYLISDLRSIGVSIEDIKKYAKNRTPEKMITFFNKKEKEIEQEIDKLRDIQGAMQLYINLVREAAADIEKIVIKELPSKQLYTGPISTLTTENNYANAGLDFYNFTAKHYENLIFPFGAIVSKKNLLKNNYTHITQCYFLVPSKGNNIRPAGRYVIGYIHGQYGESAQLYEKLLHYIKKNNLTICGNAYEEYPLNEMTNEYATEYLIRVIIQVK